MLLITLLACMDPKINVHVDITRQKGFGDTGDTALGDELFEDRNEMSTSSQPVGTLNSDLEDQNLEANRNLNKKDAPLYDPVRANRN